MNTHRLFIEGPTIRRRWTAPHSSNPIHGGRVFSQPLLPLPEPTAALPGTAAKIAVWKQRMERGQWLWHPDDAEL